MNLNIPLPDTLLSEILLRNEYITKSKLNQCLQIQRDSYKNHNAKTLSEVIQEQYVLDNPAIISLLIQRMQDIVLLKIAIRKSIISEHELDRALITQDAIFILKNKVISLCDLLITKHILTLTKQNILINEWKKIEESEPYIYLKEASDFINQKDREEQQWRILHRKGIVGKKYLQYEASHNKKLEKQSQHISKMDAPASRLDKASPMPLEIPSSKFESKQPEIPSSKFESKQPEIPSSKFESKQPEIPSSKFESKQPEMPSPKFEFKPVGLPSLKFEAQQNIEVESKDETPKYSLEAREAIEENEEIKESKKIDDSIPESKINGLSHNHDSINTFHDNTMELKATMAITIEDLYNDTSHGSKKTTILAILSAMVILFLLGVLFYFSDTKEDKSISNIQHLVEKKEYDKAIEECQKFRQFFKKSEYVNNVLLYEQWLQYNKADIQVRQRNWNEAKILLKNIIEMSPESEWSLKCKQTIKEVEFLADKDKKLRAWNTKFQNYLKSFQEEEIEEDTIAETKKLYDWLYNHVPTDAEKTKLEKTLTRLKNLEKEYKENKYRFVKRTSNNQPKFASVIPFAKDELQVLLLQGNNKIYQSHDIPGKFISFAHGYLYCFHAKNGEIAWLDYIGESNFAPIFLNGNTQFYNIKLASTVLIVSTAKNTLCNYEIETGRKIWETELPEIIITSPSIDHGKCYISCKDNICYSIDLISGQWDGGYKVAETPKYAPIFITYNNITHLFIATQNNIYAYNTNTGQLSLTIPIKNDIMSPITSLGEYLFIATTNESKISYIHCYQIKSLNNALLAVELKQIMLDNKLTSELVLTGGILAFTTTSSLYLYSIHPSDPKETLTKLTSLSYINNNSFLEFSNFSKNLLVIQNNLDLYKFNFTMKGELVQLLDTTKNHFNNSQLQVYLPLQHSGNYYFISKRNRATKEYVMQCVEVTATEMHNIWEHKLPIGTLSDSILCYGKNTPTRLVYINKENYSIQNAKYKGFVPKKVTQNEIYSIHEVYVNKNDINYRVLDLNITPYSIQTCYNEGDGILYTIDSSNTIQSYNLLLGVSKRVGVCPQQATQEMIMRYNDKILYCGNKESLSAYSCTNGRKMRVEFTTAYGSDFTNIDFLGDFIYASATNQYLYELKTTGDPALPTIEQNWSLKTDGVICSPFTYIEDTMYFSTDANILYALDLKSKIIKWQIPIEGTIQSKILLNQDTLYFGTNQRMFYAVEKNTGKILWNLRCHGKIFTTPLYIQDKIYFTTLASEFYCCNPVNGEILKRLFIGNAIHTTPIYLHPYIFIGTTGMIYIYNVSNK